MAESVNTPSLQELCEKQTLDRILRPDFTASEFAALEPRLLEILFSRLRVENVRLQEVEKKWDRLQRMCPLADIQLHLTSERIQYDSDDDEENGYFQLNRFRPKWSCIEEYESTHDFETNTTNWTMYDLYSDSPESDLKIGGDDYRIASYRRRSSGFWLRISSQLLLYRLTVMFDMPPPREQDGYKSCWDMLLKYCDDTSVITFQDYKGAAHVSFNGTSDGSKEALKLVNFLIGTNCPHSYDGILAGTMA